MYRTQPKNNPETRVSVAHPGFGFGKITGFSNPGFQFLVSTELCNTTTTTLTR